MDKLGFAKKVQKAKMMRLEIMKSITNNSVNFFKVTNFEREAFVDVPVKRWAKRKVKESDRQLLVKTGRGRQGIKYVLLNDQRAVIQNDTEYMRYHNEGTDKLPKRQFMGKSKVLDKQNLAIIKKKLASIL